MCFWAEDITESGFKDWQYIDRRVKQGNRRMQDKNANAAAFVLYLFKNPNPLPRQCINQLNQLLKIPNQFFRIHLCLLINLRQLVCPVGADRGNHGGAIGMKRFMLFAKTVPNICHIRIYRMKRIVKMSETALGIIGLQCLERAGLRNFPERIEPILVRTDCAVKSV